MFVLKYVSLPILPIATGCAFEAVFPPKSTGHEICSNSFALSSVLTLH